MEIRLAVTRPVIGSGTVVATGFYSTTCLLLQGGGSKADSGRRCNLNCADPTSYDYRRLTQSLPLRSFLGFVMVMRLEFSKMPKMNSDGAPLKITRTGTFTGSWTETCQFCGQEQSVHRTTFTLPDGEVLEHRKPCKIERDAIDREYLLRARV